MNILRLVYVQERGNAGIIKYSKDENLILRMRYKINFAFLGARTYGLDSTIFHKFGEDLKVSKYLESHCETKSAYYSKFIVWEGKIILLSLEVVYHGSVTHLVI